MTATENAPIVGPNLADLYAALNSAATVICMSSQDWSTAPDFAWLYGIFVGWSDGEGDALPGLAARFRWDAEMVGRLRRLRAAVAAFDINTVGDLQRVTATDAPAGTPTGIRNGGYVDGLRRAASWLRMMASDPDATGFDQETMRHLIDGAEAMAQSAVERLRVDAEAAAR